MTQLELVECKVPARGTQCYELLHAFNRGEALTVAEALRKYGVYALSQRVGDLKRMGWPIMAEMVAAPGGARVARYRLVR